MHHRLSMEYARLVLFPVWGARTIRSVASPAQIAIFSWSILLAVCRNAPTATTQTEPPAKNATPTATSAL